MISDIKKIGHSVVFALAGLRHAYTSDKSFRMEVNYGLPIYLIVAWLLCPFEPWELIIFTFSYFLILIVELVNTAFETMIDHLHPQQHRTVGKSKDISAAAVLVAFIFALLVVFTLAYERLVHHAPYVLGGSVVV